jgi:hypothetical protein
MNNNNNNNKRKTVEIEEIDEEYEQYEKYNKDIIDNAQYKIDKNGKKWYIPIDKRSKTNEKISKSKNEEPITNNNNISNNNNNNNSNNISNNHQYRKTDNKSLNEIQYTPQQRIQMKIYTSWLTYIAKVEEELLNHNNVKMAYQQNSKSFKDVENHILNVSSYK